MSSWSNFVKNSLSSEKPEILAADKENMARRKRRDSMSDREVTEEEDNVVTEEERSEEVKDESKKADLLNLNLKDNEEFSCETEIDAKCRVVSTISYCVVLFIIGLPVWWYTTRVYRASLPTLNMTNVHVPPKFVSKSELPLSLSLEYDVLISIVNPDPQTLKLDIDERQLAENVEDFLYTIEEIADFTVKSQWIYFTPLNTNPGKLGDNYVVLESKLPYLITPIETKTWSHMSSRPTLNLILYASLCQKSPLQIYDKNHNPVETNSFLSPRWGGMHLLTITKEDCAKGVHTPDLKRIVSIMVSQLKELIGLKGHSENDIFELKMLKAKEMVESTRRTLKSLAMLLTEINSIVISDKVARKIKIALECANEADKFIAMNDSDKAIEYAKEAFDNSEKAFSDPSLLALLYFPDDQKYAVYIPLFLPIMIPVMMSVLGARKWLSILRK